MNKSPIRVGIIGYGRSGCDIHAKAIPRMPEHFQVVAVADPLPERQEDAAKAGYPACATAGELLQNKDVELVVVASPNHYHARHAIEALRAGKHVLCEKPFGFTTADVDAMIDAANSAGRIVQAFQQRRFEPDFQKVLEICRSGLLGEITRVHINWHNFSRRWDWQTSRAFGGGQLYNNGPHLIDHAMEIFGPTEPEVWCELRNNLSSGDAEDEFHMILSGPGAPTMHLELTSTTAYPAERWLVQGTAGSLAGGPGGLRWKWVDWNELPERPLDLRPTENRVYNGEKLPWREDSWQPPAQADSGAGAAPAQQPVIELYMSLWRAIREGAPQRITPLDVRRRVAVMQRAYELNGVPFPKTPGTL